jgi:hypothetical protein
VIITEVKALQGGAEQEYWEIVKARDRAKVGNWRVDSSRGVAIKDKKDKMTRVRILKDIHKRDRKKRRKRSAVDAASVDDVMQAFKGWSV